LGTIICGNRHNFPFLEERRAQRAGFRLPFLYFEKKSVHAIALAAAAVFSVIFARENDGVGY
jgi:hypothetical protein